MEINSRHIFTDGYLIIYADSSYVWADWSTAP